MKKLLEPKIPKIVQIEPESLSEEQIQAFLPLVEERYQKCLRGEHPFGIKDAQLFIVAAFDQQQPIGLVIASLVPTLRLGQLHSIFVSPPFRHQKVASHLLAHLDRLALENHALVITFEYATDLSSTPELERLLSANHWEKPKLFGIQCVFKKTDFHPPWLGMQAPLPTGFTEFLWVNLTEAEKQRLHYLLSQGAIPAALSPFTQNQGEFEPLNSLGIRYQDQVIGWIITYRTPADAIRYASFFIFPEFQIKGLAIRLLSDAILLQLGAGIEIGELEINLEQVDTSWLNFVKKRLMPHASKVTHINQVWKHLKKT